MKFRGGGYASRSFGGYTLIEVLIFIGLTSFLLIAAITNINGNRRQVEFTQSIREFESRVNDLTNDVPTGYFGTNGNLACSAVTARPSITAGASPLGEDEDCIYVGKILQFWPDGNRDKIRVFPLAGRRLGLTTQEPVRDIDEALPVAAALAAGGDGVYDITLDNGVEVSRVFDGDIGTLPPPVVNRFLLVGMITNFEGISSTGNISEAQTVQIGGISGSASAVLAPKSAAIGVINTLTNANYKKATKGIVICLVGTDGRRASLTFGAAGSGSTQLEVGNYNAGCNS